MKIIEITPPVEKKFTIEISEKELKLIGLLTGGTTPSGLERIKDGFLSYPVKHFNIGDSSDMFGKIINTLSAGK